MSDAKPLDGALLSGLGWTAVLRWTSAVVSWAATLFVARLLVPGDYGLIAMATIPIGLVRMVEDFGLDAILVQDRSIVGTRQAQLGGFILGLGATLTTITLLLARPIAAFFNEPQIMGLISLLSLLFLADALQVVPRAELQRKLRFRRLAALVLIQVAATQTILLAAALAGFGAWSLAISNVAGVAVVTLVLWIWEPHPIHWPSGLRDLAKPLLQGWRVMASRFAYYAYATSDQTIIGRMLGKDALGSYSFVLTFSALPFQEVSSVITKVVPGIFSEVQHRTEELRRYFLLLTELMAFLTLPMTVGLALTADLLVRAALGPNWSAVAVPLQVMCGYAAFQGMQILISPILVWTGQFRAQMWCAILTGVSLPLGFLLASPYGLVAIAVVWSVLYPLTNVPPVLIGLRTVRVSVWQWLETARPAACACALMAVAVIGVRSATSSHGELFRLGAAVAVGAVVYTAAVWFLFRARVTALIDVVKRARARPSAPPSLAAPA